MDIFKEHLWYTYKEERFKWFRLTLDQVQEIIALNKNNEKSASLEEYESEVEIAPKVDFEDVVGQDSLTRFDVPKSRNRKRNNRNKNKKKAVTSQGNTTQQKSNQRRNSSGKKPRNQQPKEHTNTPKGQVQKARSPRKNNRKQTNKNSKNDNNSENK